MLVLHEVLGETLARFLPVLPLRAFNMRAPNFIYMRGINPHLAECCPPVPPAEAPQHVERAQGQREQHEHGRRQEQSERCLPLVHAEESHGLFLELP